MPIDAFATSALAFATGELLAIVLIPQPFAFRALSLVVVAIAAASRLPQTLALAMLVRLAETLWKMPNCWDSYYWALQIDGGMLLLLLLCGRHADRDSLADHWATTARAQLSLFYVASSFWKLNTSFLNPATSCAPVFVLTLLPTLGITPAAHLAQLIARASPVITILGEAAIGVLLLLPSRRLARYAVGLALLLHLGIALTPPPNNAVPFSLKCVVRLIITHPFGVSAALGEVRPLAACPPTLTLASSQNLPG